MKKLLRRCFLKAGMSGFAMVAMLPAFPSCEQFAGGYAGEFLELGSGARALGMGRAYAAVAEGPGSLLWNPAGLGYPGRSEWAFNYVSLYEGAALSEIAFGHSFVRPFGIGLSGIRFQHQGIPRRDDFNNEIGSVEVSQTGMLFGVGFQPVHNFTLGATQKIISQKIDDTSASAWDMDVGMLADLGRFRWGLEAQNLMNAKLVRDGGSDQLPRAYRIGGALRLPGPLLATADLVRREKVSTEYRAGLEYSFTRWAALRAGWDGAFPTFGASLSWKRTGIDYAVLMHDILGPSHRFTLRLFFGPGLEKKQLARADWREGKIALAEAVKAEMRIVISTPTDGHETTAKRVSVSGRVDGSGPILRVTLNDTPIASKRGITIAAKPEKEADFTVQETFHFEEQVPLVIGQNYIVVEARLQSGRVGQEKIIVVRKPPLGEAAPARQGKPRLWLAVVGINSYLDPKVPTLKYAVADAEAITRFFENQGKLGLYRNIQKKILVDQEASLSNMRNAFGEFFIDAREDDIAIIFLAGHGYVDRLGESYLLAHDSKPDNLYSTALTMREFQNMLSSRIPPRRTLVLADACHSGGMGSTGLRGSEQIVAEFHRLVQATQGKLILTASREREYSREDSEKRHGVFTYYILEALQGLADGDKDGIVDLREMYDYVFEKVTKQTQGAQHPTLPTGGFDNEMPIAGVRNK